MQVYELGYLILPSIPEDGLDVIVERINEAITKAGGNLLDGEAPIKHDLAYTMTKTVSASRYVVNDAYVGWQKFEMEPAGLSQIKTTVEKMDEILRFLLIKVPRETSFTFAKAIEMMAKDEGDKDESVAEEAGEVKEAAVE